MNVFQLDDTEVTAHFRGVRPQKMVGLHQLQIS